MGEVPKASSRAAMLPEETAMGRTEREVEGLTADVADRATVTAARAFIRSARKLPQVHQVIVVPADDFLGVWTLLDGDWTGEGRDAIYALQLATFQRHQEASIDFRVIDEAEYRAYGRATPLPSGGRAVFSRLDTPPLSTIE
jgi:hypothetical protein